MQDKKKHLRVISYAIFCLITMQMCQSVWGDVLPPLDRAKELQFKGYKVDTLEQIIEATLSKSYYERHIALELLTEKFGDQAKPTLMKALSDPKLRVRWEAAHRLGTLGDTSGLVQMQKDFKDLVPGGELEFIPDANSTEEEIGDQLAKWNFRMCDALEIAKVLAELGDTSGYTLAAKMTIEGELIAQRFSAIMVLLEIAKKDKAVLQREGLAPMFLLKAAAESEEDKSVYAIIVNQSSKMLDKNDAIKILEIAKDNNKQPDNMRRVCQKRLDKLKN